MVLTLGAVVATADGSLTLSHPEHGECYHSQTGAEGEARDLYVVASDFAAALAPGSAAVHVLDVGLGLGYNAVLTLETWMAAANPPPLAVTSLEVNGALVTALASGTAPWQGTWGGPRLELCRRLAPAVPTRPDKWTAVIPHQHTDAVATWTVHVGDAAAGPLPPSPPLTHVWQDAFSPSKNPTLWSEAWFRVLHQGAAPGCVLVTYSVARSVRDNLTAAGWTWEKIPTPVKTKRHWLKARVDAGRGWRDPPLS